GDQIGRQGPRGFIRAGRKAAGNVRQCDVDDRGVQYLHEGRQRHRHGDQPRIVTWAPLIARGRRAHRTVTDGTTEMPSGSGSFGSSPSSMTILTGTRWTILTKFPVAFSGGKAVNFVPEPS